MSQMVTKLYEYITSRINEAENDTLTIIAKGIVDKKTADKMAAEKGGIVIQDEEDKDKFAVAIREQQI